MQKEPAAPEERLDVPAGPMFLTANKLDQAPRKLTQDSRSYLKTLMSEIEGTEKLFSSAFFYNPWPMRIAWLVGFAGYATYSYIRQPNVVILIIAILGVLVGAFLSIGINFVEDFKRSRDYKSVLVKGKPESATVTNVSVYKGIVRVLRYRKLVKEEGMTKFEREWIPKTRIEFKVNNKIASIETFRPEYIEFYQKGKKVKVIWHPDKPHVVMPLK